MFSHVLLSWHDGHARDLPWRGEKDPYKIWISEIMLQQTTTKTVESYYRRFLAAFPTVRALADAPEESVLKMWEGLGYYSRARNLRAAARKIVSEYGGLLPHSAAELKTLPGIGDYTAGAIASIAFGQRELAMDGNVTRVLSRLSNESGCVAEAGVKRRLRELGQRLIDPQRPGDFNQAMMGLGNLVCVPGQARCADCPVSSYCLAFGAGTQNGLPVMPPKISKREERRGVALVCSRRSVLVRKRPDGLLGGLWEFPGFTDAADAPSLRECLSELDVDARGGKRVAAHTHVFTHIIWKMTLFRFEADRLPAREDLKAVSADELTALPMPTAMQAFREKALAFLAEEEP